MSSSSKPSEHHPGAAFRVDEVPKVDKSSLEALRTGTVVGNFGNGTPRTAARLLRVVCLP